MAEEDAALIGLVYSIILLILGAVFRDTVCYYLCCCGCCCSRRKKTKNDDNVDVVVVSKTTPKEYSLKDAYALLFCFPLTGAHHFYLDRLVHGAIYVCTFGFFGLGICVDAVLLSHWRAESKRSSQTPRRGLMNCFCLSCVGITLAWTSLIFFLAIMYIQGPEMLEASGYVEKTPVSPYEVLQVSKHSTEREIRAAYKDLAKQWHPDRNPNCDDCNEKMEDINEAFEKLKESDFSFSASDGASEKWEHVIEELSPKFRKVWNGFEFYMSTSSNEKRRKRKRRKRGRDEF